MGQKLRDGLDRRIPSAPFQELALLESDKVVARVVVAAVESAAVVVATVACGCRGRMKI